MFSMANGALIGYNMSLITTLYDGNSHFTLVFSCTKTDFDLDLFSGVGGSQCRNEALHFKLHWNSADVFLRKVLFLQNGGTTRRRLTNYNSNHTVEEPQLR